MKRKMYRWREKYIWCLFLSLILWSNFLLINSYFIFRRIRDLAPQSQETRYDEDEKIIEILSPFVDTETIQKFLARTQDLPLNRVKLIQELLQENPSLLKDFVYFSVGLNQEIYEFLKKEGLLTLSSADDLKSKLSQLKNIDNPLQALGALFIVGMSNKDRFPFSTSLLYEPIRKIFQPSISRRGKIRNLYKFLKSFEGAFSEEDILKFTLALDLKLIAEEENISLPQLLSYNPIRGPPQFLKEKVNEKLKKAISEKFDLSTESDISIDSYLKSRFGTSTLMNMAIYIILYHLPNQGLESLFNSAEERLKEAGNIVNSPNLIIYLLKDLARVLQIKNKASYNYQCILLASYFSEIPGVFSPKYRDDFLEKLKAGWALEEKNYEIIAFSQPFYSITEIDILALEEKENGKTLTVVEVKNVPSISSKTRNSIIKHFTDVEILQHLISHVGVPLPFEEIVDWSQIKGCKFVVMVPEDSSVSSILDSLLKYTSETLSNIIEGVPLSDLSEVPPELREELKNHMRYTSDAINSYLEKLLLEPPLKGNIATEKFGEKTDSTYVIKTFIEFEYEILEF